MAKDFMNVRDVMASIGCGESKAYRVIRELNAEREKRGYKVHPGKVSKSYFEARYGVTVTD